MLKVYITKGLPASGKTFWALEMIREHPNAYKRINKDDLRSMLDGGKYSKDAEKMILYIRDSLIRVALNNGKHVIVDDTNLSPKHIDRIKQVVKETLLDVRVIVKDFTDIPLDECIRRDRSRKAHVGERVIRDMYNQFLMKDVEKVPKIEGAQDIVICDLDGTLSLLNGRNPYDASTCDEDLLNPSVAEIIEDNFVVLVSGREDMFYEQTVKFLEKHNIVYDSLHMRKYGDYRKDYIIKEEIYNEHIKGKYNVKFVIDDRLQVCRMWHKIGLDVLRVGDPDADF